jgi:hypothetical protein
MSLGAFQLGISSLLGGGSTAAMKIVLKSLKKLAKHAVENSGLRMRNRRSFITAELQTWKGILSISPGLLGPRFPQILASLAFAKAELLSYFRHAGLALPSQSQHHLHALIRKDTKKHVTVEHYRAPDIAGLIFEVYSVLGLARQHSWITRR